MITITIQNASFAYHQEIIFTHLNLQLSAGKFTCLLGPSGVGKSSLLHWLAHSGEMAGMQGELSCSDQKTLSGRVALMTQQDTLLPWLSTLDNVVLGYCLRREIKQDIFLQAKHLLQQLGLRKEDFLKLPKQLSGGMRQRVALARILLENKPVVLLDEPFAALDVITRYKLQELLAEFLRNKTVLLVTHDPLEALRLADDIYLMQGMPAKLHHLFTLNSMTPRDATAPELLIQQANLLQRMI